MAAASSCANSLWSMAMSVTRPALSRASVAPGTSRSTRCATACSRAALRARVASSWAYSVRTASPSRISATAPFSATIAATGQLRAKGSLQPSGRPVMAITGTPAAAQRVQRRCARRVEPAVGGERVVDVGHHAAHAPQGRCRQGRQGPRAAGVHVAPSARGAA